VAWNHKELSDASVKLTLYTSVPNALNPWVSQSVFLEYAKFCSSTCERCRLVTYYFKPPTLHNTMIMNPRWYWTS